MEAQEEEAIKNRTAHVLDPFIVDAVKEMTFNSKQRDGYPHAFEQDPFSQYTLFGPHSHRVGVLDFFEGLSTFAKVEAGLQ